LCLLSRCGLGCGLLGRCLLRLCGFAFSGVCLRSLLLGGLLGRLCAVGEDFRDADGRQFLTMTAVALRVLTATLLERDDLAGTALFDDFGGDEGTGDGRGANGRADHQDFCEFYDVTGFASNFFDLDEVVCGNAILLATGLDDCEHLLSFRLFGPALISTTLASK